MWFVAEKGKHYVMRQESVGVTIHSWIEDSATGKKVGGPVGSDDEPPK